VDLSEAIIKNEKIDTILGISYLQLRDNEEHHNKLFYDRWGIPWKHEKGTLYYSDETYGSKYFREWNEANMRGPELSHKKFFTPEEFEKIKPSYL
jgi:hypothetical protein